MRLTTFQNSARRGTIAVLAALFMVVIFGLLAFVTDLGFVTVSRTRQYAAVDAAALAAVDYLADGKDAADAAVYDMLELNGIDPDDPDIEVTIEYGLWNLETQLFALTDFLLADTVRVEVTSTNIQAFFGPVLDQHGYTTRTEAIAMRGGSNPRDIALVIDCSGSMGGTMSNGKDRITNARDAAQLLIDQLSEDDDRVGLAVYSWSDPDRDDYEKTGHKETDLSFNHTPTSNQINLLTDAHYTGGTNIGGGLRAGLDIFLDDPSPRPPPEPSDPEVEQILVLLTDGQVNKAEPYPTSEGPLGVLPVPWGTGIPELPELPELPLGKKKKKKKKKGEEINFDASIAVTKWANTIKARGIKIHVITLGSSAHSSLMVNAASPDDEDTTYYHHISDGGNDAEQLLDVYLQIGRGNGGPRLVK